MDTIKDYLLNLPRSAKRLILALNDLTLMIAMIWVAFFVRLSTIFVPPSWQYLAVLLCGPLICLAVLRAARFYGMVTRFIGVKQVGRIALAITLGVLIWSFVILLSGVKGVPRSIIVMFGVFSFFAVWGSRLAIAYLLRELPLEIGEFSADEKRRVLIYGAGETGTQLQRSYAGHSGYRVMSFVDDNATLTGQRIDGVKVYPPNSLERIIERDAIEEVILAMPSATHRERQAIIKQLEEQPVNVTTLPSMADIASGRVEVTDLRPIDAADLLGRDQVPPDPDLLGQSITGKCVMVTGAGGSIGSELTRQIVKLEPARLVLFELSEIALYSIEMEVNEALEAVAQDKRPELVSVLGSVCDRALLDGLFALHSVQTVFHSAAYKHVPLVERNARAGLENNVVGTRTVAAAAEAASVERVVLISTDKAVRPTNVMGASKRLAELVLQAKAETGSGGTIFTMVRFGNVLDSSGSVVHRFRKQISEGGPVTVTHPEIIRYFMSIPEAALLVIQAGAMATGGEVFVLDMGEPVKIADMARSMIRLSGRTVQDAEHPEGDIAIVFTGLREGEKLYEELLIAENVTGTKHPRIMRNTEPTMAPEEIDQALRDILKAADSQDLDQVQTVLERHLKDYTPDRRDRDRQSTGFASGSEQNPEAAPSMRTLH